MIGGVMCLKTCALCALLTATLTSVKVCHGRLEDFSQRRKETISAQSLGLETGRGSVHLSSVVSDSNHKSAAPARNGSLAFTFGEGKVQKPGTVWSSLLDAKLKRLDPTVQCSNNLMTLQVKQARMPHFLVASGEGRLIPLSQMPSSCGYSVKRSRRDVQIAAPYQGCHVTQQGADYVLPLRLWGAPMTMSCPAFSPPPSVSCFPSGMVVKLGGVSMNEIKVKVSGTWKPLSLVCSTCGLGVEVVSGGLTLTAPYHQSLCIETKDGVHSLSLQLADVELLATCASLPDKKPTTAASSSSDGGHVFLQHPANPRPSPPTGAVTPAAQLPSTENQQIAAPQQPAHPFLQQYQQFPQYLLFPRPVPPTQPPVTKNIAASHPQSTEQYAFQFSTQFPMVGKIFHPVPPSTPPAIPTQGTTPAPTEHDRISYFHPSYPFLSFPQHAPQPQTANEPKVVLQEPPPPPVYPQIYPIPMLYPPLKYSQNIQPTPPPATTSTTSVKTPPKPALQKPFYHPYPHIYYVPQQAAAPVFPPPKTASAQPQHERQPNYYSMSPFYPLPSHPRSNSAAGASTAAGFQEQHALPVVHFDEPNRFA